MNATMCSPIRASRGRHVRLQPSAVSAVSIIFSRVHLPSESKTSQITKSLTAREASR